MISFSSAYAVLRFNRAELECYTDVICVLSEVSGIESGFSVKDNIVSKSSVYYDSVRHKVLP